MAALADSDDEVIVLSSLHELQEATEHIQSVAEHEVIGFRNDSPRTAYLFATTAEPTARRWLNRVGRPLTVRTTYDTALLELPRAPEVLRRRGAAGEEFRFLGGLPFSTLVADSSAAILDTTSFDSSGKGCLFVRDRRLVLAIASLTEMVWRMAAPRAVEGQEMVDEQTAAILGLLAAGATDATIAAHTGMSKRTVERKVRVLLAKLGASTRFQAGVQAARRGWL